MAAHRRKLAVGGLTLLGALALAVLTFRTGQWLAEFRHMQQVWVSDSRFAQIGMALAAYHSDYGCYPPTRYSARDGGPLHSWRILVSPYIDFCAEQVVHEYDFSADWNSPSNLAVVQSLRSETNLFSVDDSSIPAQYLAIGEEDEWPTHRPLRAVLFTTGGDRFLVVEYYESSIEWAEPKY